MFMFKIIKTKRHQLYNFIFPFVSLTLTMCLWMLSSWLVVPNRFGPDTLLFSISGQIPDIETTRMPNIRLIFSTGYPVFCQISNVGQNRISGIKNQPNIRPNPSPKVCVGYQTAWFRTRYNLALQKSTLTSHLINVIFLKAIFSLIRVGPSGTVNSFR